VVESCFFLIVSWRKWNDPVIDFGRELYTPWRLAEGAVLYRDVQGVYGPFSQYLNAFLFRLFGPGISVLVGANLIVLAGICAMLYFLFRRAWGPIGAWCAMAVFIAVFGFAQLLPVANFNYVLPYSHEATHGMLIVLVLTWALLRWVERPVVPQSLLIGVLLGMTWLIKPEFILAGMAVTVGAFGIRAFRDKRVSGRQLGVVVAGVVGPSICFCVYFSRVMPFSDAVRSTSTAWWAALTGSISSKAYQRLMLGLDEPFIRLGQQAMGVGVAVAIIGGVWGGAYYFARRRSILARWLTAAILVTAVVCVARQIEWIHCGRCLLGLALIYLAVLGGRCWQSHVQGVRPLESGPMVARVLLTLLAVVMMTRMFLNGRVWQFGFFQAALSGMVVTAVVFCELPRRISEGRLPRALAVSLFGLLLGTGLVALTRISSGTWEKMTLPVGRGKDTFLAYPPELDGAGDAVRQLVEALDAFPRSTPLLVLPEGLMVNYLARMRSALPYFQYYSFVTENGMEAGIVEELKKAPPELVALLSRDLTPFGIERYGQKSGEGQELLTWVQANYFVIRRIYDDPLNASQRGAILLRHRSKFQPE